MAAGKFDGQVGDAHNDLFNAGVSYDREQLHLALTYLTEDQLDKGGLAGRDRVLGGAGAYTFGNGMYLAIGYQNREYRPDHSAETSGHTLDISSAYPISDHYRIKLGYFDFDDGINNPSSQAFNGVNATMEWLPAPGLRFHLEYLNKDFEQLDRFWSWSIGFRYDLSRQWEF